MQNKFAVIDQFREEAKKREIPLTLSMGFSYGDSNHEQIGKVALLNLNLAKFVVVIRLLSKKMMSQRILFTLVVAQLHR